MKGPAEKSTAFFQTYAHGRSRGFGWRLLTANNRELGRSLTHFETQEESRQDIAALNAAWDSLRLVCSTEDGKSWIWRLFRDDEGIVTSGRMFDRRIRCEQAGRRFLDTAPNAAVRERARIPSTIGRSSSGPARFVRSVKSRSSLPVVHLDAPKRPPRPDVVDLVSEVERRTAAEDVR